MVNINTSIPWFYTSLIKEGTNYKSNGRSWNTYSYGVHICNMFWAVLQLSYKALFSHTGDCSVQPYQKEMVDAHSLMYNTCLLNRGDYKVRFDCVRIQWHYTVLKTEVKTSCNQQHIPGSLESLVASTCHTVYCYVPTSGKNLSYNEIRRNKHFLTSTYYSKQLILQTLEQ